DKLHNAGREDNYLVSGTDRFNHPVYPQSNERKNLFYLFEELFAAFKQQYSVPDFKPFTNERIDVIEELPESKQPETRNLKPETNAIKRLHNKFRLLNEILSTEMNTKRELGGLAENGYDSMIKFVHEN
ncbi:MAG TPA: hypothetical protein DCQ93_02655, partial [Bacteroidetes bacterium]|nr:hypothetical protein [Bacteroidota bacterium]